jgi:hypothetical protein
LSLMRTQTMVLGFILSSAFATQAALEFSVLDESGRPAPCRIHLRDASEKPVKAPELPFWSDHFVCTGKVSLALDPGKYTYEIERGPEYNSISNSILLADKPVSVTNRLRRIANLPSEGWWPGETHVHRKPEEIPLHMQAEDLHVAHVITWWNNRRNINTTAPPLVEFDHNRFYHLMAGEDERGGGALLYLNLSKPFDITGARREFPPSVNFMRQAPASAWIDIEKPFWWDVPIWLAQGRANSIGIAHNHHHRGGMLDNEAWGKPRDLARFGTRHGVGLWTQEIYFHLLNCGFRIPPSAGSASGVLPNPVGYNRAYVHLEGELTWEKWHENLRAGRVFVSSGPLLRCRANGQLPGQVFRATDALNLEVQGRLDSRDPIRALELIHNGRATPLKLPGTIRITESGWFLVRAIADLDHTFRFACTGPWYVELGTRSNPARKESSQFFLDWTRERLARLEQTNFTGQAEALQPIREAETFWRARTDSPAN